MPITKNDFFNAVGALGIVEIFKDFVQGFGKAHVEETQRRSKKIDETTVGQAYEGLDRAQKIAWIDFVTALTPAQRVDLCDSLSRHGPTIQHTRNFMQEILSIDSILDEMGGVLTGISARVQFCRVKQYLDRPTPMQIKLEKLESKVREHFWDAYFLIEGLVETGSDQLSDLNDWLNTNLAPELQRRAFNARRRTQIRQVWAPVYDWDPRVQTANMGRTRRFIRGLTGL
jgi:hypothetical protein